MNLMKQFVKERDKAIRSLDVETFKRFYKKWYYMGYYRLPLPADNVIEISMRKMLCEIQSATEEEKKEAEKWLIDHGSQRGF